jgi:hypothetical protein
VLMWHRQQPLQRRVGRGYTGLEADMRPRPLTTPWSTSPAASTPMALRTYGRCCKRRLKGTYVCPQAFHLLRHLDERVYMFNVRDTDDLGHPAACLPLPLATGLTYAQVTGSG